MGVILVWVTSLGSLNMTNVRYQSRVRMHNRKRSTPWVIVIMWITVEIMAVVNGSASSKLATSSSCSPFTIPLGQCWQDPHNRISSTTGTTTDACCTLCQATPHCTVFVLWKPDDHRDTSTNFSCALYRAKAPTIPCTEKNTYIAGIFNRPPLPPPPPAPKGSKDVLLVAIDDLRPELGCYGCGHMQTPNFDAFARDAVVFDSVSIPPLLSYFGNF